RGGPAVASVPAADDVAGRDVPARGVPRVPGGGVRVLPPSGRGAGRVRGEAHGLAGGGGGVPEPRRGPPAVRGDHGRAGGHLHTDGAAVLHRRGARVGALLTPPLGTGVERLLVGAQDRLGGARRRGDALVTEGREPAQEPVRGRWSSVRSLIRSG